MGDQNCDVEHFLDLRLKRPRRHHLFDTLPGSAKCLWVVRERAPEVVDEIGLPRPANVIKDDARLGGEFIVGKQLHCRHGVSRWFGFDAPRHSTVNRLEQCDFGLVGFDRCPLTVCRPADSLPGEALARRVLP